MKKLFLAILMAALIVPTAFSDLLGYSHFHWAHSGLDANGNQTTIDSFTLKCGRNSGAYTREYVIPDGAATSEAVSSIVTADGEYFCVITATNAYGESEPSTEHSFFLQAGVKIVPGVPAAPSSLVVEAE